MNIIELKYLQDIRQRIGLEKDDSSRDEYIASLPALARVRLIAGWNLGYAQWADTFISYFESQGLYLTSDSHSKGRVK